MKRDAWGLIALHLRYLHQELPGGQEAVPFEKCLEEVSLSLELPMEIVRGVLVEMQGQGILLKTGDSLSLVDREKLLKLTESVGKEQGASPESTAP